MRGEDNEKERAGEKERRQGKEMGCEFCNLTAYMFFCDNTDLYVLKDSKFARLWTRGYIYK